MTGTVIGRLYDGVQNCNCDELMSDSLTDPNFATRMGGMEDGGARSPPPRADGEGGKPWEPCGRPCVPLCSTTATLSFAAYFVVTSCRLVLCPIVFRHSVTVGVCVACHCIYVRHAVWTADCCGHGPARG
jgi:hypothetical protein